VIFDDARLPSELAIRLLLTTDIAHDPLFCWADAAIKSRYRALSMKAFDLKFAKLDVEVSDEVFENIPTLCHQLLGLLFSENLLDVFFGALEVWEQKNENFLWIARDFNEVYNIVNLVEIAIADLSTHFNSCFVVADVHGRRPSLGNDVNLATSNVAIPIRRTSHGVLMLS